MALPKPLVALKDHCSVIYNNTLYTFQQDAFQSLELRPGGQWSPLPMGVSTNGSVCIQGSPKGEDSLFVVGGTANSSAPSWYSGLQQYSFKNKQWKQLTPLNTSAKNRVGHSSAYLNSSDSILIYAGSQDGRFPSSQTFTILTRPPYTVIAYNPAPPPLIQPLIMPLNASHALMLGGGSQNKDFYTFGPRSFGPSTWQQFPGKLKNDLKNSSYAQAVITYGGDDSQLLEFFDMSASPNEVTTQSLQQAVKNRKREDRPAYNSTLASSTSRTGFSLAQDPAGLIVISGGALNDSDYLCLFNQTGNQWIDPARFFEVETKSGDPNATPTTSSSPSSTQSTPSSSTSAPTNGTNSKSHPMTILGATLGAVFGLAALLLILLLLLRYVRRRKARNNGRDHPLNDKDEMDFADRGVDFMREAGGSLTTNSNHKHTGSGHTITSLAIMSGSARAGSRQSKRGFLHKAGDSSGSAKSFFSRAKSPLAPSPSVISGPFQPVNPRDQSNLVTASPEPRTDVGWSTYFANNSATNLDQSPPGNARRESASRPTTYASNSQSDYASSRITSSNAHESAEVQPLSIRTNVAHPPNSRVVSPTSGFPFSGPALAPAGPGVDPPSPSTLVSVTDEEEEHQHDEDGRLASEGMASWTPVAPSDRGSTWTDRPVSSIYAESNYPHPGERVRIPNFPRVPSTARNSTVYSQAEPTTDSRGMRSVASREFKTQSADVHDRELPEIGSRRAAPPTYGPTSDGMVYPRRPEETVSRGRGVPEPEDMSWLNLGR